MMNDDNDNNNNHLIVQILPKLGAACFAIRRLFHTLNIGVLRIVYFAYL